MQSTAANPFALLKRLTISQSKARVGAARKVSIKMNLTIREQKAAIACSGAWKIRSRSIAAS